MNYVRAEQPAPAAELIDDAERLMEDYFHKRVILERADARTADGFRAHGWTVVPHLIMAHTVSRTGVSTRRWCARSLRRAEPMRVAR